MRKVMLFSFPLVFLLAMYSPGFSQEESTALTQQQEEAALTLVAALMQEDSPEITLAQMPGAADPGATQPRMMRPGQAQPGMMQPGMMGPEMMQQRMMGPGMMHSGMWQQRMMGRWRAPDFFLRLKEQLRLTEEQIRTLSSVRFSYLKEAVTRRATVSVAELELRELTSADKWDVAQAEAKIKEIGSLRTEWRINRMKALAKAREVLTDEQTRRLRELRERSHRPWG